MILKVSYILDLRSKMLPTNPEFDAWIKLFGCQLKIYWKAKVWILRLEESLFDQIWCKKSYK